ncbi:hypothetical protein E1200_03510 [Actinomadura sp. GC306]|uniref:hypothetical protein n=1 Tax=Actinomadura sp. GC306 TaxID=2530367 RepID=UPI00104B00F6|nr:hypothetical protein [Actinomadura sp. GC306]TDC70935.1 hypothetical protein E1200_03510 [Actinomadura sp. GC306]
MHWWSQQACDAAAEAQAADPSPGNLMAAAQVQAMVSVAEALHRIAAALEDKGDGEGGPPARPARRRADAPGKPAFARPK